MQFALILLTFATQALSLTLCGREMAVSNVARCKSIDCNYEAIKCLVTDDFNPPTDSEAGTKTPSPLPMSIKPTNQQPWKCMICDHDFSKLLKSKDMPLGNKVDVPKTCKVLRESKTSTHVLIRDEESKTIAYFTPKSDWPTTGVVSLRRRAGKQERKSVRAAKIGAAIVLGLVCSVVLIPLMLAGLILKAVFQFFFPPPSKENPFDPDWW
jgi:hypothetical protein